MPRISIITASLGLILSSGVAAQPAPYPAAPAAPYPGAAAPPPGYPPPGYPPPGYPPPTYPTAAAPGQPYTGPDGLTYVNGAPVYYAYGAYLPLVFIAGLGWGYYGPGHHWLGAPGPIVARLDRFYPGGRGFPGGGFHGRPGEAGFHGGGRDFGRH